MVIITVPRKKEVLNSIHKIIPLRKTFMKLPRSGYYTRQVQMTGFARARATGDFYSKCNELLSEVNRTLRRGIILW